MEIFEFCLEIIKREGERFNVGVDSLTAAQLTAANANDVNYDVAHNRCSYMYRCGTINVLFAKECYGRFMTEYKHMLSLIFKWMDDPNLTLCSISKGPALDYIGLLLHCYLYVMSPPLFKTVKLISKYGAWRNTVNIMHQIISEGHLLSLPSSAVGNIEVIQGDPFHDLSTKVKEPINNSDVVMMSKCLNLQSDYNDKKKISSSLLELFNAMKPGAILFCTDTKPAIALITSQIAKFPGEFLLEPIHMSKGIAVESAEFYKNAFGCFPVVSARGSFFVWKKSSEVLSDQLFKYKLTTPVKRSSSVNCINDFSNTLSSNLCNSNLKVASSLDCLVPSNLVENCNIPNLVTKNVAATLVNSESSVQYVSPKIKNISEVISSLPPIKNELEVNDTIKKEINSQTTTSEKYSSTCSLASKSIQTELNDITERDHARIVGLTQRVAKLTASINELLQGNEQQNAIKGLKTLKEGTCECVPQNDVHHCSFRNSCMCCYGHSACSFNSYSNCCQKQCVKKLCDTRTCHSDHMVCNYTHPVNCCDMHFSAENMSSATPNLVIPFNSISNDVLMQIISLLSQANKRT